METLSNLDKIDSKALNDSEFSALEKCLTKRADSFQVALVSQAAEKQGIDVSEQSS